MKPKHFFCISDYGDYGLCGPDIKIDDTETAWKNVTCKKCLRKRKAKRPSGGES